MKKILVLVLLLAGLLVVADVVARTYVTNKIEAGLASSLGLSGRANVTIGGFPFIPQALQGELDEVEVEASTLHTERGGLELEDVTLVLENVRFSFEDLLDGSGRVVIRSGHGTAAMDRDALIEALAAQGLDPAVAQQEISPDDIELAADTTLSLGAAQIELPVATSSMTYDDVKVEGDRLVLAFSLGKTRLVVKP